jgi:D-xylose transport system substrate-binding protein
MSDNRRSFRRLNPALGRMVVFALVTGIVGILPPTTANAKVPLIAFSMRTHVQMRWDFDEKYLREYAKEAGANVIFQWANDDPATQASQFENLLTQKPDVIVLCPVDSAAVGPLVKEAHEQHIPVIAYNVGVTTAKVDYVVRRDDVATGEMQAKAALEFAPNGVYALLKGDAGTDVAHIIGDAWEEVIKKYNEAHNNDIKIVFDQYIANWDPKTAQADAENVLSAQSDHVNAFLAVSDGIGLGADRAIMGRHLQGKVFVSGLDGDAENVRLVAEGVQTIEVYQDLNLQAKVTIAAAMAFAEGKKPESNRMVNDGAGEYPAYELPVYAIKKNNVCEFITKVAPAGWVKVSDVFPNNPDACK